MQVKTHVVNETKIAEVISEEIILKTADDGLQLLGNLYYEGFDKIILSVKNVSPDFFDLKNGIAGEVLQKFSNYRVGLALIGDFSVYSSKSVQDFIFESNKSRQVNFLESVEQALGRFSEAR
ncbi:DUF4180 domain-containing protein [Dyadobacter aurulentus]|uniref:DUF4180 domain-containing protein n=1 Tax=Dyadobacter sp. UC 10 TaxID=2605428 RepID=UPI0011F2A7F4|nr:DUF4180 domain-containing protein [Dyadobacter sp. UC 10]KAA0992804.1 DUF4180 domain-containing protein [Dyadobacter sp. UC 10]